MTQRYDKNNTIGVGFFTLQEQYNKQLGYDENKPILIFMRDPRLSYFHYF